MADEQIKTSSEDEYQFPQEEYAAENAVGGGESAHSEDSAAAAAKTGSIQSIRSRLFEGYRSAKISSRTKRIMIIAGALIGVMIVAHFLHTVKRPEIPPVSQTVSPKPQPQPQPVFETQAPQPQSQPVTSVAPQPIDINPAGPLDEVRAYNTQSDSKIQELQSQVTNVEHSLSQSEATNLQLQKSVAELSTQVQALSTQLKQRAVEEKKMPQTKKVIFYLRAVVPDRAWVMTPSGETVSVSIGDSLDQYGTIKAIDPVYGVIETSSGRKITYGQNDY